MNHLIIFSILASFRLAIAVPRGERITNGDDAKDGEFPFMAVLNTDYGAQFCNGVILDTKWILTTASCITALSIYDVIKIGSYKNLPGMGTDFKIAKQIIHEGFDQYSMINDIGLLQVDGEMVFDNTTQAITDIGDAADGTNCQIIGWGMTEDDEYPGVLQHGEMTIIDLETCKNAFTGYIVELGEGMVCLDGHNAVASSFSDHGAALLCEGKLVGIDSRFVIGRFELPDIFTRVVKFKDWIDSTIAANTR